jgi:hypothetical protein
MTKLLSVVETPAYLSKAAKLLSENERAAVVAALSTGFIPTVFLQFCFGYSQRTRQPT